MTANQAEEINSRDHHGSGPDRLADLLLSREGRQPPVPNTFAVTPSLSASGIHALLRLAYYASQTPDEGRYPRLKLFTPGKAQLPGENVVVQFAVPRGLPDADALRRLAPVIQSRKHALWIAEEAEQFSCRGIVMVDYRDEVGLFRFPRLLHGAWAQGTLIHVEGPGHLRVCTEALSCELRGGRVRTVESFCTLEPVAQWFGELTHDILVGGESAAAFPLEAHRQLHRLIAAVWAETLSRSLEHRHGGAFALLPLAHTPFLEIHHPTRGPNLRAHLEEYWHLYRSRPWALNEQVTVREAMRLSFARLSLDGDISVLANLSQADGCVVLSRDLELLGFSAEIRDFNMEIPENLRRFGTRHRSAWRLCAAVPGTVVFIISQDGALRVAHSTKGQTVLSEPLDAALPDLPIP